MPESIRDDFTLLRAQRLQSQIPLLYLTLFLTIPTAIYAAAEGAPLFVQLGIPAIMGTACLMRFFTWVRRRNAEIDVARAEKLIKGATWVSSSLGVLCSIWCVVSWLSAAEESRIYYPMIMAMGSLATAYCLSTIRVATIANLAIGLLPISVLLLTAGNRMDLAAGTSLVVASAFLLRMIVQQHEQLVDLLVLQRRMRELAHTDPLTGLLNRRAFDQRLEREIADSESTGEFLFALVDLDGFKPVNDRYGHAAGDVLLCEVAERLRQSCGTAGVVARLGGDEFAILAPRGSAIAVTDITERMLSSLVQPCRIEGHMIRVGASVGVARWPVDGACAQTLFEAADKALYLAKGRRTGTRLHGEKRDQAEATVAAA